MRPLVPIARWLGEREWFARLGRRTAPVDLALQRWTGGRVSALRMVGLPCLVLTAVGRKSGRARSVPLLYTPHGRDYVVVASNWGQRQHPGWSSNLLACPEAQVCDRGRQIPVVARLAEGAEREQLWRAATALWPAYDSYDVRSGAREIRVFVLSPRANAAAADTGTNDSPSWFRRVLGVAPRRCSHQR